MPARSLVLLRVGQRTLRGLVEAAKLERRDLALGVPVEQAQQQRPAGALRLRDQDERLVDPQRPVPASSTAVSTRAAVPADFSIGQWRPCSLMVQVTSATVVVAPTREELCTNSRRVRPVLFDFMASLRFDITKTRSVK